MRIVKTPSVPAGSESGSAQAGIVGERTRMAETGDMTTSAGGANPRDVLIIESGEGVGGSAFSMFRIIKYIDRSKYRMHAFVYYRTKVFADIEALGVPVTVLPIRAPFPPRLPEDGTFRRCCRNYITVYGNLFVEAVCNGLKLARFIRRNRISIIHCNNGFFENIAAVFAARLTGTPCVAHIRGTEPLMRIERYLNSWLRKAIVLNQQMLDEYADAFGSERVALVYNGVDLDLIDAAAGQKVREEFSIDDGTFSVGTFARIEAGKGIEEFIIAAAKASRSRDDLVFFIAGAASPGSRLDEEYRSLAAELGIGSRVIFAGWRDDAVHCMAAMDLILQVSTTYPEGMSLAPIEAMALSKPVIVTDNPGYANIVLDNQTGFVVPMGDTDRLAELICRLADDRGFARQLGRNGRRRVLEEFDYRIVARHVEDIYAEAAIECDRGLRKSLETMPRHR